MLVPGSKSKCYLLPVIQQAWNIKIITLGYLLDVCKVHCMSLWQARAVSGRVCRNTGLVLGKYFFISCQSVRRCMQPGAG